MAQAAHKRQKLIRLGAPLGIAIACDLSRKFIGEVQIPKELIEHFQMNSFRKKGCYR